MQFIGKCIIYRNLVINIFFIETVIKHIGKSQCLTQDFLGNIQCCHRIIFICFQLVIIFQDQIICKLETEIPVISRIPIQTQHCFQQIFFICFISGRKISEEFILVKSGFTADYEITDRFIHFQTEIVQAMIFRLQISCIINGLFVDSWQIIPSIKTGKSKVDSWKIERNFPGYLAVFQIFLRLYRLLKYDLIIGVIFLRNFPRIIA